MGSGRAALRQLLGWLLAAALAVLVCNGVLYVYHHPPAWIDRQNGATNGILNPGSRYLHGQEGRGLHLVDEKGYLNPDLPLARDYALLVGSSYIQGKEVPAGQRLVDLMNAQLDPSGETLPVYSVSQDGFYFPDVVKCFRALLGEFPDAKTIILEVNANDFSARALQKSLEQHEFDPSQTGENLVKALSRKQKLVIAVKEAFPILNAGKTQLTAMLGSGGKSGGPEAEEVSMAEAMDGAVALLRSEYEGRLIIFYHPDVELLPDGSMEVIPDEKAELLRDACRREGVEFVDVSQAFLEAYGKEYAVPTGFSNTTMASGHLNVQGNRICAEVLLEVLKGGGGA